LLCSQCCGGRLQRNGHRVGHQRRTE
jgi:hypothetical protein